MANLGRMSVWPANVRYMDREIGAAELDGIFENCPPEEVRFYGSFISNITARCVRLARKYNVPIRAGNSSMEIALKNFGP